MRNKSTVWHSESNKWHLKLQIDLNHLLKFRRVGHWLDQARAEGPEPDKNWANKSKQHHKHLLSKKKKKKCRTLQNLNL